MREKLIELLEGSLRYAGDVCGETGDCSECQYDKYGSNCGYAIRADYFIANGVTIATDNNVGHKWISVTERLPKHGEIVLAFGKRHATSGMFRGTSPTKPNWWHWKGNMYKEVSHWMPLPEAPKGE